MVDKQPCGSNKKYSKQRDHDSHCNFNGDALLNLKLDDLFTKETMITSLRIEGGTVEENLENYWKLCSNIGAMQRPNPPKLIVDADGFTAVPQRRRR